MVVEKDTVCLLAGKYVVWCEVVQVVHLAGHATKQDIETVVTKTTWRQFAPWCESYAHAIDFYVELGDGGGYVFMRLNLTHTSNNFESRQPAL